MHKDKVQRLAERLIEKETIVLRDLQEILGDRPYDLGAEMNEYIKISDEHQSRVEEIGNFVSLDEKLNGRINEFIENRVELDKNSNLY